MVGGVQKPFRLESRNLIAEMGDGQKALSSPAMKHIRSQSQQKISSQSALLSYAIASLLRLEINQSQLLIHGQFFLP